MTDPDRCRRGTMRKSDTPLRELEMDVVDFGFLTAARHFCASFASPQGSAWVFVMLSPETFFPGAESAEKMRRALAVVQEMRTSRRSTFRFSNPLCACCAGIVTQDERHLIQLVQHARMGQRSGAASSAMLLCEGHATKELMLATHRFAETVGAPQANKIIA